MNNKSEANRVMRYLLPCACGRQIPISTTQAGETLVCECGRSLMAPKLRELRQLPEAPGEDLPRLREPWSRQQGVLFASGFVLLLLSGTILGVTIFQRNQLHTEAPRIAPDRLDEYLAQIDKNTPLQNFELWQNEMLEQGLDREGDPIYVLHRKVAAVLLWIRAAAAVGALLGLGMMISAFVVRPQAKPFPAAKARV
jgi:hypothetical protein